jgi:hypothetical protein
MMVAWTPQDHNCRHGAPAAAPTRSNPQQPRAHTVESELTSVTGRGSTLLMIEGDCRDVTMSPGLQLTIIWFDSDVVEIRVQASNGQFERLCGPMHQCTGARDGRHHRQAAAVDVFVADLESAPLSVGTVVRLPACN